MATEAARLKSKNPLGDKRKTDLTLTGLLMEGLEDIELIPVWLYRSLDAIPRDSFCGI
jgi:hypothetical protein